MAIKDWTKKLKKATASKGKDTSKMEITPYRDWRVLAGIFLAGLIVSLGFNIFMSVEINGDNFFTAAPKSVPGVSLNKSGLDQILSDFAKKDTTFQDAVKNGVSTVDPSL